MPVVPRASTEINSRVMRTYEYHRRGTVEIRTIQARLRDVEYIEWQRQGRMNSFFEALRDSRILNRLFRAAGTSMESRLRHRLHDPFKILLVQSLLQQIFCSFHQSQYLILNNVNVYKPVNYSRDKDGSQHFFSVAAFAVLISGFFP